MKGTWEKILTIALVLLVFGMFAFLAKGWLAPASVLAGFTLVGAGFKALLEAMDRHAVTADDNGNVKPVANLKTHVPRWE